MKRAVVLIWMLAALSCMAQVGVGQWRDYLSCNRIGGVAVAPDAVYAAAPMGLMAVDRHTGETSRLNKTTILNDVGVAEIAYDDVSGYLVVAYTNSNLDLVRKGKVSNLSDIRRSDIPGDKGINSIRFHDGKAYLACGFGLVVVDLARKEIKETYYLGDHGGYDAVYDVAFAMRDGTPTIYAGTSRGLLYADAQNPFLNIVDNWTLDSHPAFAGKTVRRMETHDGHLIVGVSTFDPQQMDIYWNEQSPTLVYGGEVGRFRCANGRLAVAAPTGVRLYGMEAGSWHLEQNVTAFAWGDMEALDAVCDDQDMLWIGHEWGGLIARNIVTNEEQTFRLQGPASDDVFRITTHKGRTLVAPGGKKSTNESLYNQANIYILDKGVWNQMDRDGFGGILYDAIEVAVNPRDTNRLLAVAWGSGVMELEGNKLTAVYDETNTPALSAYTDGSFRSLRVGSVAYDKQGNAWITNSLADKGLVELTMDGEWHAFNTASMVAGQEIDRIIWDSINDYKWFIGKANRIYVHDGKSKMAYVDPNNGSRLETHTVNCLAQDHDGEIWFGTDKGIKVIYDGYKAFSNGGAGEKSPVNCSNIIFSQDGVDEYLMAYENISCIAVDGANRKWVGTANNGLYLISENGQRQIHHFTAANSSLFSDRIVSLAVQPRTGEVMVGTDHGLQSYRGTATYASYYNDADIHAFPNPVRPDYDGPVAIKGFSRNALVHVTDAAGHIVFSTKADGGQAVWNLRTNAGEPVKSGVYFVLASDVNGQMRAATKILVVR